MWTVLTNPGTYIGTIGVIFAVYIGAYYFNIFWFRPATSYHKPYSPVSLQYAIVDDDVAAARIYRTGGMAEEPRRLNRNHDLCIDQEAIWLESHSKEPALLKEFL